MLFVFYCQSFSRYVPLILYSVNSFYRFVRFTFNMFPDLLVYFMEL